ncbi:hypothetical protein EZS27_043112, partial [termite gut metagenome]
VIIDWHSHHIRTEEAKAFFAQMAAKYKDVPNIIYEIFNEPVDDSWEALKAYSEEIIKTIRAEGAQNLILVGTSHWDQDIHLPADNPIIGYRPCYPTDTVVFHPFQPFAQKKPWLLLCGYGGYANQ